MLASTDPIPDTISMFSKPGGNSPNRGAHQISPSKPSGPSGLSSASATTTQPSSTIHPSPGRGHRGTSDIALTGITTGGKDNTSYHSNRSTNAAHHYPHYHGSAHHYHHRDGVGHTVNDFAGQSSHGPAVTAAHHHTFNTNYSYANHHHVPYHANSFRVSSPAHQLRDFLLAQWRQFESGLPPSLHPRSTPVKVVSINGSSNSPGTPPTLPPSVTSCRTPTPTNLTVSSTDRSTPTGTLIPKTPESPVTSDHSGSLPRRLRNSTLENATCVSAENVHTLASPGYRNKMHGGSRGGFGGSLARHGSSDVTNWQRGHTTTRKNSSPTVFATRGPSTFSSMRVTNPHSCGVEIVSESIASVVPTTTTSKQGGTMSSLVTTVKNTTISTVVSSSCSTDQSPANSNNNNQNTNALPMSDSTEIAESKLVSLCPVTRPDSPTVSAPRKPPTVLSPVRVRPQTADPGTRRNRGNKHPTDTTVSQKLINHSTQCPGHATASLDGHSSRTTPDPTNESNHSPVGSRWEGTNENSTTGTSSPNLTTSPIGERTNLSSSPDRIGRESTCYKQKDPTDSNRSKLIDNTGCGDLETSDAKTDSVTSAMIVNVMSGPLSPPQSPNRADTPNANGEQYWTPDPPASPSTNATPVSGLISSITGSHIIPDTINYVMDDSSARCTTNLRCTNEGNMQTEPGSIFEQRSARTRLESLNDVD